MHNLEVMAGQFIPHMVHHSPQILWPIQPLQRPPTPKVEPLPAAVSTLVEELLEAGVCPPTARPNACTLHVLDKSQWMPVQPVAMVDVSRVQAAAASVKPSRGPLTSLVPSRLILCAGGRPACPSCADSRLPPDN